MSSVDNRLVKMTFDNEDFEQRAGKTLGTLDKLKQSLDFSGALKGMDDIKASAEGVSFEAISNGIEALQGRFSVLGEFVHGVFSNIINKAADVGKSFAESLTITPMKEGFSEYELQMNSVQTIMASTGESVDTVNGYLDKLNEYADKTIYSFSDMTANIGKFTNAGVTLDSAVNAIQGVSNVAAVSGANTNEASRAMYNFAQALSAGSVKLIDWKSIENANMGTVEFKQSLIDTAVAMGTLTKEGDKYISTTTDAKGAVSEAFDSTMGFNDSLSHQWMTTDVLVQTLGQYSTDVREMSEEEKAAYEEKLRSIGYTEDQITAIENLGMKAADSAKDVKTFSQLVDTLKESLGSGWTKSWQYIFGDLEEAKTLWSEIYTTLDKYISKSSDARNALLEGWAKGGGRTAIIDSLRNAFEALVSVMTPIKDAWDKVFPAPTVDRLIELSNKLKDFTEKLKLNDDESKKLKNTLSTLFFDLKNAYEGLKSIGETVYAVFKAIASGISEAFGTTYVANIGMIISRFREFADAIKPSEEALNNFKNIVSGVASVLRAVIYVAIDAGSAIFDAFMGLFEKIKPDIENLLGMLGDFGNKLKDFAQKFQDAFNYDTFSGGFGPISDAIFELFKVIRDGTDIPGILSSIFDKIFGVDLSGVSNVFNGIAEGASSVTDVLHKLTENVGKFFGGEGGIFSKAIQTIKNFIESINWNAVFNVFSHVESFIATKALWNMSKWLKELPDSLGDLLQTVRTTPVDKLTEVFDGIQNSLKAWQQNLKAMVLVEIGAALIEIAKAVKEVSSVPPDRILSSLEALGGGLTELIVAMRFMKKSSVGDVADVWGLSQLIEKLGEALKKIGEIQPERLKPSIKAMGVLLAEMVAAMKVLNGTNFSTAQTRDTAIALGAVALALESLGKTLERLSKIPFDQMKNGLIAIGGLMAEMTIAIRNFPKDNKGLIAGGAAMMEIAVAIRLLAGAVEKLANLSFEQMVQGIAGVGALIGEMTIAIRNFPKDNKHLMAGATAMIEIAAAVRIIAGAVEKLGTLSFEQMAQGIGGVGVLITEMTAALRFMPKSASVMASAFAMDLMAIAINGLVGPVEKLGSLNLWTMVQGLGGVGVLLAEVVAALRLMPSESELLASSAAMIAVAKAMDMLADVVAKFGNMSLEQLAKGLGATAIALGEFVAALRLMPKKGALIDSVALIGMATAMNLLVRPITSFGSMDLGQLAVGIGAMAGSLIVLGVAADRFSKIKDLAKGVAGMMGVAIAITVLAPGLTMLGTMNIGGLGIAIGALAGTFTIFGIAAKALTPSIGVIFAFAAAVALTGIGLFALASAIGAIASIVANSSTDISATLGTFLQALIDNVPKMTELAKQAIGGALEVIQSSAPQFGSTLTTLITTALQTIIDTAPKLGETLYTVITTAIQATCQVIRDTAPKLGETLYTVITTAIQATCQVIRDNAPTIIDTLFQLLMKIINTIVEYAPQIFEAALTFITSFLRAIAEHIGEIVQAGIDIGINFINGVAEKIQDIIEAAFNLIIKFIEGLATAIDNNHQALFDAIAHLIESIVHAIIDGISTVGRTAGELITGQGGILEALGSFGQEIFNAGANLVQGFINGLGSMPGQLWDAACGLANQAWNAITQSLQEHSPSRLTFGGGANFTLGFINGIESLRDKAAATAGAMAFAAMDAFDNNIETDSIYNPTITPVVDASEIQNGITGINSMFDNIPATYDVTANLASNNGLQKQLIDIIGSPKDYSTILNGMKDLRNDLASFNNTLSNLQVILDSGTLVGAIAPQMDDALGKRQVYAQRGMI